MIMRKRTRKKAGDGSDSYMCLGRFKIISHTSDLMPAYFILICPIHVQHKTAAWDNTTLCNNVDK